MQKRETPHILVVDDDSKVLDIVQDILTHEGYRVSVAATASDALRVASQDKPDLILLDLVMPGVDGTELLRELVAMDPTRPVIVISGHGDIPKAVETILQGASNFLEKPLKLPDLLRHVDEQLRRGRILRQTASSVARYYERYGMIGTSPPMRKVYDLIERVAPSEATVLLVGETGTGKELAATAIHRLSRRSKGRFVAVNCSAFPESLLESQLFGHRKGAFTGAVRDYDGLFVQANGGTLFLDEIGSMSWSAQAKVLRTLETGDVQPVGGELMRQVDVRVIAASNRNLEEEVKAGRFREDLFYRLNVVRIHMPPLRERREDIPLLVDHFVGQLCADVHKPRLRFTPAAMRTIVGAYWCGNVRELRNFLERAVLLAEGEVVDMPQVLQALGADREVPGALYAGLSLREARRKFEREFIRTTLIANSWSVNAAARQLGIERTNLYRKMRQLGIDGELSEHQSR